MLFFYVSQGPNSLHIVWKTETSVSVTFIIGDRNNDVGFYKATFSPKTCQVLAAAFPLSCILEGLQAGTQYLIKGFACLTDSDCSGPTIGYGTTLPDSKDSSWKKYDHPFQTKQMSFPIL